MLIYSGDVDACLPYTGSLQWVSRLGLNESSPWRPWTTDGGQRMGGYVVGYGGNRSGPGSEQLQFATVRGAGHMVPEFRPVEALELVRQWLAGNPLPRFNASLWR